MESEATIRYEPFKEVVVMHHMRFPTPDDLARFATISAGGKPSGIYWARGVAFIYFPLATGTSIVAKAVVQEKKVYWAFVSYALMPQYRPIIETKEKMIVPIIDMSPSSLFEKVAEWLKEQR